MKRIAILIAVMTMAIPGTAVAASSSSCQAYNPQLCAVANADGPSSASTANAHLSSGTLPFTGLDVALLAVGGGGLLGIGLVVRRFSSHPRA